MAVTVALTQTGGYTPHDEELYITFSDGDGKWLQPLSVTDNEERQEFFPKGAGADTPARKWYGPRYASVAIGQDGHPLVLMVCREDKRYEVTREGATTPEVASYGEGKPMVFVVKL